jgi:hypothetical protein
MGLIGAALGTAGSLAFVNLLRLGQLWYLEDLQPYDRKFLKPAVAGLVMAGVLVLLKPIVSGVALIVTGVGLGVPAFLATLSLLGIERRERLVYVALQEDHRALLSDAVGALAGRRR